MFGDSEGSVVDKEAVIRNLDFGDKDQGQR